MSASEDTPRRIGEKHESTHVATTAPGESSPGAVRVFLIGFMATGKSTVARIVAARRGWRCIDTDAAIEERTGRSVAEIFSEHGESAFRDREHEALSVLIADEPPPFVVSTGGGLPIQERNWSLLTRHGVTVSLEASPETLAARVGDATDRPLLAGVADKAIAIGRLLSERQAVYERADLRIDTSDLSPEAVADRIDRFLRERV